MCMDVSAAWYHLCCQGGLASCHVGSAVKSAGLTIPSRQCCGWMVSNSSSIYKGSTHFCMTALDTSMMESRRSARPCVPMSTVGQRTDALSQSATQGSEVRADSTGTARPAVIVYGHDIIVSSAKHINTTCSSCSSFVSSQTLGACSKTREQREPESPGSQIGRCRGPWERRSAESRSSAFAGRSGKQVTL